MDTEHLVDAVQAAVQELRAQLTAETAATTLTLIKRVTDELGALRLEAVRVMDAARRREPTAKGRDTAGELADQLQLSERDSRRSVRSARALDELPQLAAALAAGEVTPAAVDAIVGAASGAADIVTLRAAESELVELARRVHPDELARRARWVVAAAPERQQRTRARQRGERSLSLRAREDGMVAVTGALLPEVGEAWRTILDSLVRASYRQPDDDPTRPDQDRSESGAGEEDRRSARQRTHDAFARIGAELLEGRADPASEVPGEAAAEARPAGAGTAASKGDAAGEARPVGAGTAASKGVGGRGGSLRLPWIHGAAARVVVAIDLSSFDPNLHRPELLDALGIDPAQVRAAAGALVPAGAGLLPQTGTLLPAELVRQLATSEGAELIPVLFDGFRPLARGRTRRFAGRDLHLALALRDQGCVDCGAPPMWCDADHDPPWEEGGRTDPDQLVLRCRACHVGRQQPRRQGSAASAGRPGSAASPRHAHQHRQRHLATHPPP